MAADRPVDAEQADRAQAKTVWSEAAKANDVWACLQLEEWGRNQKPALRLGSYLDASTVHGQTLLAAPDTIRQAIDLGDRILVSIDRRAWLVAPDGRPLRTAVTVAPTSWAQAVSWDGAIIASAREIHDQNKIEVGSVQMSGGRRVLDKDINILGVQDFEGVGAVADDGSAVAFTISSSNVTLASPRSLCVAWNGEPKLFPDAWSATSVGRNGAWLVGHIAGGQALLRGTERKVIAHPCAGAGMLACVRDGKPILVLPDGKDMPMPTGRPIGKDPHLLNAGGWLALVTGGPVKGTVTGDMFGDNDGKVMDLPTSILLWRWSDLAADPNSLPTQTILGQASYAYDRYASLWNWTGTTMSILDLAGVDPVSTPYLEAPSGIWWAWTSGNALVIKTSSTHHIVYGSDKTVIWQGECNNLWVKRPDLLLTRRSQAGGVFAHQLQRMSKDSTAWKEIPLPLTPIEQAVYVGFRRHEFLTGGPVGSWVKVDIAGTQIGAGSDPRPDCQEWDLPRGRFYRENSRLFLKAQPYPTVFGEFLQARDAYRFGPVTVVLDQDCSVFTMSKATSAGKKRGEWSSLGLVPGAVRLAMSGGVPAVVDSDDHVLATLISGPALNRKVPPATIAGAFPASPWRIDDRRFIVPRGREFIWDEKRVGFEPFRLRGPDDGHMLVITRSVVIELDGNAAKLVGRGP